MDIKQELIAISKKLNGIMQSITDIQNDEESISVPSLDEAMGVLSDAQGEIDAIANSI